MCSVDWFLVAMAILIFAVLMLNNIPGMWKAGMIAITSTHHKNGDGDELGELILEDIDALQADEEVDIRKYAHKHTRARAPHRLPHRHPDPNPSPFPPMHAQAQTPHACIRTGRSPAFESVISRTSVNSAVRGGNGSLYMGTAHGSRRGVDTYCTKHGFSNPIHRLCDVCPQRRRDCL